MTIKENAPHVAGHYLYLGGPGRNRTTDTRIFNSPPIDRFRFKHAKVTPPEKNFVHKAVLCVFMRLIWLSYFDPRKDSKTLW